MAVKYKHAILVAYVHLPASEDDRIEFANDYLLRVHAAPPTPPPPAVPAQGKARPPASSCGRKSSVAGPSSSSSSQVKAEAK